MNLRQSVPESGGYFACGAAHGGLVAGSDGPIPHQKLAVADHAVDVLRPQCKQNVTRQVLGMDRRERNIIRDHDIGGRVDRQLTQRDIQCGGGPSG